MRTTLLAALFLLACGSAEAEKKLAETEKKAEEQIAKAEKAAKAKVAEIQRQLDDVTGQLAAAKAKVEEGEKAKESLEEQAKLAEVALKNARQAFKDKARLQLADLNKELGEAGAKAGKLPAKSKAAFTKAVQDVKKQQAVVAKDIAAFDTATVETLKTVNAKVQNSLAVLKNKIRAARAKVP
jgi:chromosome segregation ATPase